METQVIRSASQLASVRRDWNELVSNSHNNLVQMTHEWIMSWWSSFGGANQLYVIAVHDSDGHMIAIAPFMKGRSRYRGVPITKMSLTANGHSPSSDIIVRNDQDVAEIVAFLFRHLRGLDDLDLIELTKLDTGSHTYRAAVEYLETSGSLFGVQENTESPYILVDSSWDTFFRSRSSKFRRTMRNKLNRASKSADLSFEKTDITDRHHPAIQDMLSVSSNSWKGELRRDIASNPDSKGFFLEICDRLGPQGVVTLWQAKKDGVPIAFEFHLTYDGIVYPLRADFHKEYERLSPGSILEYHILKSLFDEARVREYDSCGHTYHYLLKWSTDTRKHASVEIFGDRLLSHALYGLEYKLIPMMRKLRLNALHRYLPSRKTR